MLRITMAVIAWGLLPFSTGTFYRVANAISCFTFLLCLWLSASQRRYGWAAWFAYVSLVYSPLMPWRFDRADWISTGLWSLVTIIWWLVSAPAPITRTPR